MTLMIDLLKINSENFSEATRKFVDTLTDVSLDLNNIEEYPTEEELNDAAIIHAHEFREDR